MVINTTIILIHAIMALVVAIISATIMRAKLSNWDRFGIGDAFLAMLFGVVWPITIVVGIVYLVSDFIYGKFFKKYGP
jgi:putative copper export protein